MSQNFKIFIFMQTMAAALILSYACYCFSAGKMLLRNEEKKGLQRPSINIKEL